MKELLNSFTAAIILLFCHWAIEQWPSLEFPIYILSIVLYFIIFRIIDSKIARDIKAYRRRAYPQARAEGYWIGKTVARPDDHAMFTIAKIYYSRAGDCWVHHGYRHDAQLHRFAEWKSQSIQFSRTEDMWFFDGTYWPLRRHENISVPYKFEKISQFSILEVAKKHPVSTLTSRFYNAYHRAGHEDVPAGMTQWKRVAKKDVAGIENVEDIDRRAMQALVQKYYHPDLT